VAEFSLGGRTFTVEPTEVEKEHFIFAISDTTNGSMTYGAGRYLYTSFPDHGLTTPGALLLDLNRLVNPPCAYTTYVNCPLPSEQNRLSVPLPVGEQQYHDSADVDSQGVRQAPAR
jgi:uncharacterized protein (DUF1684 family)